MADSGAGLPPFPGEQSVAELRAALEASRALESDLRKAANDAAARASAYEAEAKHATKQEQAAKSQINRFQSIAEKAETDFLRQKELLQAAIARVNGFQVTINQLRTEVEVYKHKAEYAEKELISARAECQSLGLRLMETQKAITAREGESAASSATLKHQLATMLYEVENEREQRKRAEERLPQFTKQLASLKKMVEDKDAKLLELATTREKDIAELEAQLRAAKENNDTKRYLLPRPVTVTELSRAQAEVAKMSTEYGSLKSHIEDGLRREEVMSGKIAKLEEGRARLAAHNAALQVGVHSSAWMR